MSRAKPHKLLWVGDAVMPTGFGRVSSEILGYLHTQLDDYVNPLHLKGSPSWDIVQLGVNYWGDPHDLPYRVYPASVAGSDPLGIARIAEIYAKERPDLVVCLNDPWIVEMYLQQLPPDAKVVAYMPVDAEHIWCGAGLNRLKLAICYTQFGATELRFGGYSGPLAVIPHGVNKDDFYPITRSLCRQRLGLDKVIAPDAFIVSNINRNQIRKRFDLTIAYFARWWEKRGKPANAHLLLHCALQDHMGWDVYDLVKYFGIDNQTIFTMGQTPNDYSPIERLRWIYGASDVQISTTVGEGWGLTAMEGMACRRAQVLPNNSAFAEWARGASLLVPCDIPEVQAGTGVRTVGRLPEPDGVVNAIDAFYNDPDLKDEVAQQGYARVTEPRFTWAAIGAQFHTAFKGVLA